MGQKEKSNFIFIKLIILVVFIIGLIKIFLFFISNYSSAYDVCKSKEKEWRSKKMKGAVIDKYVDSKNHMYKTGVFIQNENDTITWYFNWDKSKLYSHIDLGDSLIKSKESLGVKLIKPDTIMFLRIDLECEKLK